MQFNSSCLILWYVFFKQYYTQFYNSEQNVVLIRDSMNIFKSRYVKEPFKQAEHMQSETNLYCPKTLTHVACLNLICLFLAILIICRGISTSSAHSGGDFVLLFFFYQKLKFLLLRQELKTSYSAAVRLYSFLVCIPKCLQVIFVELKQLKDGKNRVVWCFVEITLS